MNFNYHNTAWLLLLIFLACKDIDVTRASLQVVRPVEKVESTITAPEGPKSIVRSIIESKNGDIWIAGFDGVFRYDGTTIDHVTKDISSDRFFSLLEDSKGNIWMGSLTSGVFRYDGSSFENYNTDDGLLSDAVVNIFQDSEDSMWFGVNGGASKFNGQSFINYVLQQDYMIQDSVGLVIPAELRPPNEVNAIIQDLAGNMWFATRDFTYIFDGSSFESVSHEGLEFGNVRWLINDKHDQIWLGGKDGLWRYDGSTYINYTDDFIGYIYEDLSGNIWTSSQKIGLGNWLLTKYDAATLYDHTPTYLEIPSYYMTNKGMLFGILQDFDKQIWVGGLGGVYQCDGYKISRFNLISENADTR